jgi:twitching motility protein PilT
LGSFQAKFVARPNGVDITFVRTSASRRSAVAAPAPAPAHVAPPPSTRTPPSVPSARLESARLEGSQAFVSEVRLPVAEAAEASPALGELVARAAAVRASDLHLADGDAPRVRVDGKLRALDDTPLGEVRALLGLSTGEVDWLAGGRTLDRGLDAGGAGPLRVHVYKTSNGLAAALRLLPPAAPSLSSLRIQPSLQDLIGFPHGLVLVCGAAGSGKSTTLAALAQEALYRRSILLVTLEDPIEYQLLPGPQALIRRRQVGRDVRDFPSGLRDALREDLDVLIVGELRDAETIQLALTAAETGHLVLASLHSRSAASAIARIVDAYPAAQQDQARSQLADVLRAVVAQRLLPRARGSGRVPAIELLRATSAVSALIREGKQPQLVTAMQSGKTDGMVTLERSLATLVQSGEVDLSDARAAANDPASLDAALR